MALSREFVCWVLLKVDIVKKHFFVKSWQRIYCFEFEFAAGETAPALLLCVVNSHQAVRRFKLELDKPGDDHCNKLH